MQDFRDRPYQYIMQIIGLLVVVINLWLGSKLAPLAQNIEHIATRVSAIEKRNERVDPLVTEYIKSQKDIEVMKEDIQEIRGDLKELKHYFNLP